MRRTLTATIALSLTLVAAAPASSEVRVAYESESLTLPPGGVAVHEHVVLDTNGDGRLDIVAESGTTVWTWLQDPNGTFPHDPADLGLAVSDVRQLLTGDFDGDGRPDLVINDAPDIVVAFARSAGGFDLERTDDAFPYSLQAADVDGDGDDDLIASGGGGGTRLTALEHTGSGWSSTPAVAIPDADPFSPFGVGDVDGDGRVDLFVRDDLDLRVYLQAVDGSFGADVSSVAHLGWLAHLNGDDHVDMASGFGYYPGDGEGGFGSFVQVTGKREWGTLIVGDIDGDGRTDTVTEGAEGAEISFQRGSGGFTSCSPFSMVGGDPLVATDLNSDGHTDLILDGAFGGLVAARGTGSGLSVISADASATTLSYGRRFNVEGKIVPRLTCPSSPLGGVTVSLWRSDSGAPFERVQRVTTSPGGIFDFDVVPPNIGHYEWQVRYAGDADHAPSASAVFPLDVWEGKALDVRWKGATVDVGSDVAFTVDLDTFAVTDNRQVDLFIKRYGRASTFWKTVTVDPDTGLYAGIFKDVPARLTITAVWSGDELWPEQKATDVVDARVLLRGRFLEKDGQDGRYALYRAGRNVSYGTVVVPAIVAPEYVMLQRWNGGAFRTVETATFRPNADGVLVIVVRAGALTAGERYRLSVSHEGGEGFVGDRLPWAYFRIVA